MKEKRKEERPAKPKEEGHVRVSYDEGRRKSKARSEGKEGSGRKGGGEGRKVEKGGRRGRGRETEGGKKKEVKRKGRQGWAKKKERIEQPTGRKAEGEQVKERRTGKGKKRATTGKEGERRKGRREEGKAQGREAETPSPPPPPPCTSALTMFPAHNFFLHWRRFGICDKAFDLAFLLEVLEVGIIGHAFHIINSDFHRKRRVSPMTRKGFFSPRLRKEGYHGKKDINEGRREEGREEERKGGREGGKKGGKKRGREERRNKGVKERKE
jgi:hypothetical protein